MLAELESLKVVVNFCANAAQFHAKMKAQDRASAAKILDSISAALVASVKAKDAEDKMAAAAYAAGQLDVAMSKLDSLLKKAGLEKQLPELREVIELARDQKKVVMLTGSDEARIAFSYAAGQFDMLAESVRENI